MPLIFVNYRTHDEESVAALVDRELSRSFGDGRVFRASKSIRPGDDFSEALLSAVRNCDVLISVIGVRWLSAKDGRGGRALDNVHDWTRREIVEAMTLGIPVIPLLVGPTSRLDADSLPAALANLARLQYLRFDHRNVESDLDRLTTTLAERIPGISAAATKSGDPHRDTERDGRHGTVVATSIGTVISASSGPVCIGGVQHIGVRSVSRGDTWHWADDQE